MLYAFLWYPNLVITTVNKWIICILNWEIIFQLASGLVVCLMINDMIFMRSYKVKQLTSQWMISLEMSSGTGIFNHPRINKFNSEIPVGYPDWHTYEEGHVTQQPKRWDNINWVETNSPDINRVDLFLSEFKIIWYQCKFHYSFQYDGCVGNIRRL